MTTAATTTSNGEAHPAEIRPLPAIRAEIDGIDRQILALIGQRAVCAQEVAKAKRAAGEEACCYRPEREAQVLRRIMALNQETHGPLADEEVARLFREIMSACLALEEPLAVAYLGPEGTYSQLAMWKQFGRSVPGLPCASIDEIFREVETAGAQFGLVPVENSIEGVIHHTLDRFLQSPDDKPIKICGEVDLRIHHHLLSRCERLEAIARVYAHPQALGQCRRWLATELPRAEQVPLSSNAEAARRVAGGEAGAAAIASAEAGELYGLATLRRHIADDPDNTTRFLVLGRQDTPPSGRDKTSLLFATANKPGALHQALTAFAEAGVSMTRIESRPSRRGNFEYVFFVDVEGHESDAAVAQSLAALRAQVTQLKVLGSYPQAVL
jgi:chorismate mutase/prephenate dehydratase